MIGMAAENCHGAIKLFCDKHSDQLMRQGHGTESDNLVGARQDIRGKSIGTANGAHGRLSPFIAQAPDHSCKGFTVERRAFFVKRNQTIIAELAENGVCLFLLAIIGTRRAALG